MVIEWLKFRVNPQIREKFIQKDEEIWAKVLAKHPGFLGKEIWISPKNPEEVIIVIHWKTLEEWQSIPSDILDMTEKQFAQEMIPDTYEMIETGEYQVRKFPRS